MSGPEPQLRLRAYLPKDHDACATIYAAARRQAFHWCRPELFVPADFARDSAGESITVAEAEGAIRGFVSLWTPDHFVHLLFVDPRWQGRGIGRRLLRFVETTFGDWAWLKCQSQNERALAFYTACGWSLGGGGVNELGPWVAVSWNMTSTSALPDPASGRRSP